MCDCRPTPAVRASDVVNPPLQAHSCIHIFTASVAPVGVCLTVIDLIRVVIATTKVGTLADDLLAVDAMLLLLSYLLADWSLHVRNVRRTHRLERMADTTFLIGLLPMIVACGVVTWTIVSVRSSRSALCDAALMRPGYARFGAA